MSAARHLTAGEIAAEGAFWRVLHTTARTQVAAMTLGEEDVSGEFGTDHAHADQVLYCVSGRGTVRLEGRTLAFEAGDALVIPAGEPHQVRGGPCTTLNVYGPVAYPDEAAG